MTQPVLFDKIELSLVRVFHTVITERSVSRAAIRLGLSQPAVSAQLKRLRALCGDPLLVRSGPGMAPTDAALRMLEPAAAILQHAQSLFGSHAAAARRFEPATSTLTLRIAASDFLDPWFLPAVVVRLRALAPGIKVELQPLTADFDYRRALARGEVDLVVGNWLQPSPELHLGRLLADEVVCLVAADHPAARAPSGRKGWNAAAYLAAEHVAPMPTHTGARGVIDEHLSALGLTRNIVVRSASFATFPRIVAHSRLVLTTGRLFCSRYLDSLPLRIVRCPIAFPAMTYYQLWHDLTHHSAAGRWLRDQVREVARGLSAARSEHDFGATLAAPAAAAAA